MVEKYPRKVTNGLLKYMGSFGKAVTEASKLRYMYKIISGLKTTDQAIYPKYSIIFEAIALKTTVKVSIPS